MVFSSRLLSKSQQFCGSQITFQQTHDIPARCFAKQADRPALKGDARHLELPVIASCGLDSYLRLWDIKTRQLLSAVFLKQHLTNVVFDSNFSDEGNRDSNSLVFSWMKNEYYDVLIPYQANRCYSI